MGDRTVGYHIDGSFPVKTRLMTRAAGVYDRVGATLDYRLTIRNEATFRRAVRDVLAWEFDRVIPGHGAVVEGCGKRAVIEGFEWVLGSRQR